MRFIHLALIMVAVYVPSAEWALPALATINIFFALIFYWLTFGLVCGLKSSTVNSELEVSDAWTSRVVQLGATAVLLMSGDITYIAIAMFSLPWIIINVFTDIFATLLKWEVIEVMDKEE